MNVKVYGYDTKGLYEWGTGYTSRERCNAWKKFWDDIANTKRLQGKELFFWRVVKPDSDYSSHMLLTLNGAIYAHPMYGKSVFQYSNCIEHDAIFEEFKEIMRACSKAVGCSIDVYSKKGVVSYEE